MMVPRCWYHHGTNKTAGSYICFAPQVSRVVATRSERHVRVGCGVGDYGAAPELVAEAGNICGKFATGSSLVAGDVVIDLEVDDDPS